MYWPDKFQLPYIINRAMLFGSLDELMDESRSVLGKMAVLKPYDNCLCACSSHGCTPAIMMLKGIMKTVGIWEVSSYCIEKCIWVID